MSEQTAAAVPTTYPEGGPKQSQEPWASLPATSRTPLSGSAKTPPDKQQPNQKRERERERETETERTRAREKGVTISYSGKVMALLFVLIVVRRENTKTIATRNLLNFRQKK